MVGLRFERNRLAQNIASDSAIFVDDDSGMNHRVLFFFVIDVIADRGFLKV